MITIYGTRNCSIVKRARDWLDGRGIAYRFHDYAVASIERSKLEDWVSQLGWEALLDRAGITFLMLPHSDRQKLNEKKAMALMLAQPAMIRRPLLEADNGVAASFHPGKFEKLFERWIPAAGRA